MRGAEEVGNPTQQEIRSLLNRLVDNGSLFLDRSAAEVGEHPVLSVAHFATGLELLLKARILAEDWSQVAAKPGDCVWASLISGGVFTVSASRLHERLASVCR